MSRTDFRARRFHEVKVKSCGFACCKAAQQAGEQTARYTSANVPEAEIWLEYALNRAI